MNENETLSFAEKALKIGEKLK